VHRPTGEISREAGKGGSAQSAQYKCPQEGHKRATVIIAAGSATDQISPLHGPLCHQGRLR
jgi:hypothetical protein